MLDHVIQWSLRYRVLVLLAAIGLLVYGGMLATTMPIDVFPDLDRPRVVILTECPGMATEDVEILVSQQLEIAMLGAAGVQDVRSQSTAGLNVLYVEFDWNTDIRAARQTVQERLATLAGVLPEGIRPLMTPTASIMGQIVIAGIYRQTGPNGGDLTKLEGSDLLAEAQFKEDAEPAPTERASDAEPSPSGRGQGEGAADTAHRRELKVWQPADRRNQKSWRPVTAERINWSDKHTAKIEIDGKTYTAHFADAGQQAMELRELADWVVRPRLRKIAGVAEVFVQGGDTKQYQILINPQALLDYNVSLQQVEQALQASNINTSGGFALEGDIERPIRVLGRLGPLPEQIIADLRKIPVREDRERPVLLEKVARVVEGPQLKRGDAAINGHAGVVFTIVKQPHIDTRVLTDNIATALADVEASLPADLIVNSELFRLKNFIDRGIFNVAEALVIGAVLVIIVLFLFLLNLRTTFITLTAIPLSLVITTLVFRAISYFTGTQLSINVMTLGGLAVAMGELVDDAIVDVENIFRRLKENHALARPLPALTVVYEASREIRGAIVFGTAVVILVFLPLFALSGVEGRLFAPLGVAYIVSILASLGVSLTITPVLSYYLLPQSRAAHREGDGPLLRSLKWLATPLIRISMAIPGVLLLGTWLVVGVAGWQLSNLGRDFLPPFDEGSIQVNVMLPPGSSLDASNRVAELIDAKFRRRQQSAENPDGEILYFVRRTGRAELDEHAMPVSGSEYILSMNPNAQVRRDEIIHQLLDELRDEVAGVDIEVEQPLAHLISHMVSGVYAQIAIQINGDDLDVLLSAAREVQQAIKDVPGVTPPVIEPIRQAEEWHIRLRPESLADYGLTRAYVATVLQTALQGEVVSQVFEGQRRFDLLVRLEDQFRTDFTNMGRLRIDLPNNRGQVELGKLADVGLGVGANAVNRDNARRRIVVRCNTQGRDLASVVADVRQRVAQRVSLPQGYFIEYGGQFESQERATWLITVLAGVSVVGMFGVLMLLFPSIRVVLQILNALPTAFIGGVLALVLTGQSLTVASLVGFISLGGIAVRNGILLVTHYLHLMHAEGEAFSPDMVLRGSLERLAPVLMTAITAGVGLIPLVVGGQAPGREVLYPVATVILGGLITSTFCEFLIHPGIFLRFSGADATQLTAQVQTEVLATSDHP